IRTAFLIEDQSVWVLVLPFVVLLLALLLSFLFSPLGFHLALFFSLFGLLHPSFRLPVLVLSRWNPDQSGRHVLRLDNGHAARMTMCPIPASAGALPVPAVDEEDLFVVVGDDLNARLDHHQGRRSRECDADRHLLCARG